MPRKRVHASRPRKFTGLDQCCDCGARSTYTRCATCHKIWLSDPERHVHYPFRRANGLVETSIAPRDRRVIHLYTCPGETHKYREASWGYIAEDGPAWHNIVKAYEDTGWGPPLPAL